MADPINGKADAASPGRRKLSRPIVDDAAGFHDVALAQHIAWRWPAASLSSSLRPRSARSCSIAGTSRSTTRCRGATSRLHAPALVFVDDRRRTPAAQRHADLAQPDAPAQAARRADARPDRRVDAAAPRVPARQCRRHRRQSRPAHARGCAPPHRPLGRSSASACCSRRSCSPASSACCGRCRAASSSTSRPRLRRSPATWCGQPSSTPAPRRWLSWLVGRPLIRLNADLYAREAELRFSLMRVNEHVDAISLAAGEADERRRLELDLRSVLCGERAASSCAASG